MKKRVDVVYKEKGNPAMLWRHYGTYRKKARARRFARRLGREYPNHNFAVVHTGRTPTP